MCNDAYMSYLGVLGWLDWSFDEQTGYYSVKTYLYALLFFKLLTAVTSRFATLTTANTKIT